MNDNDTYIVLNVWSIDKLKYIEPDVLNIIIFVPFIISLKLITLIQKSEYSLNDIFVSFLTTFIYIIIRLLCLFVLQHRYVSLKKLIILTYINRFQIMLK